MMIQTCIQIIAQHVLFFGTSLLCQIINVTTINAQYFLITASLRQVLVILHGNLQEVLKQISGNHKNIECHTTIKSRTVPSWICT
jgi:hypothetical protein